MVAVGAVRVIEKTMIANAAGAATELNVPERLSVETLCALDSLLLGGSTALLSSRLVCDSS